jgi:Gpi18-like mannosyltransferase
LIEALKGQKVLILSTIIGLFTIEAVLSMWTGLEYDMKIWFQTGFWMSQGTNIYIPNDHMGYPPLWAFWCLAANRLYGLAAYSIEIWRFLIKLPLIVAQLVLPFAIAKFAEKRFEQIVVRKIFWLTLTWSFLIYIAAFWGQLNIISALLTFLAFWAIIEKRTNLSGLFLGVAATLKIYPLITLPIFLIFLMKNRDKHQAAKFLFITLVTPVVFTLGVFTFYQWDFLAFIRTIFYWAPMVEANPLQIQGGCMNIWSFLSLWNIEISNQGFLRLVWIPLLGVVTFFWFRKSTINEAQLNLSLISVFVMFLLSYSWVTEQMFLDPLPFIFLQILAYNPKRLHLYVLIGVQILVFAFSVTNWGVFIFEPLLTKLSSSAISYLEVLEPSNPIIWNIRGWLGLSISLSLSAFLMVLLRPKSLHKLQSRILRK